MQLRTTLVFPALQPLNWEAGTWKELSTKNPPPVRAGHSAVFDVQTSSMLVFGGLALNSFEATCDDGQHIVCALLSFNDCFDFWS